ncbi:bet1-like snare 1-1 [Phtheirospermum japonicum]|uniref:Bet1-like snare 1-1 n=1 Tax=Phtheirospermum japonicum TaxID=374723 RepID=A0A830BK68_9LAMI|nr:bet1-like snare 1-1 [Phtheirospermum japonicum]
MTFPYTDHFRISAFLSPSYVSMDRNSRAALFDGIEEGGIRASLSYSSHEINEQENDRALGGLQDRVNLLKRAIENGVEKWQDLFARIDQKLSQLDRIEDLLETLMRQKGLSSAGIAESASLLPAIHPVLCENIQELGDGDELLDLFQQPIRSQLRHHLARRQFQ